MKAPSSHLAVVTKVQNRRVADVCITVCDGSKELPEAVNTVWKLATVQQRIVHLIRNTFRYASRKRWAQLLLTLHRSTPPHQNSRNECGGTDSARSAAPHTRRAPSCGFRRRRSSRLFLDYIVDIQILSLYQRHQVVQHPLPPIGAALGDFPNEQAALKCLYMATRSLDLTGKGKARWTMRWKPALNASAITFERTHDLLAASTMNKT